MHDVLIIGAGSMGMAAGYYLAKQHKRVVLIDPYDPPHTKGSHHGETRLIRHAYGEGETYVPLALRAQKLWHELEAESGDSLFHRTGVLNIGTRSSIFLQTVIASAKAHALPFEQLTSEQVNARWPGFRLLPGLVGCYEPDSGVLMSDKAIRTFRKLAVSHGATLLMNSPVTELAVTDDDVTVTAGDHSVSGHTVIVAAGKGTNAVLSMLGQRLPLQPVRKTFSWFETEESAYHQDVFPAWSFDDGKSTYYGFPSVDGAGAKIGRHDKGMSVTAEEELAPFGSYAEDEQDVTRFAADHLSAASHKHGKVCTYTMTPDEDFIIDWLPGFKNVLVACGFSGHGFKFSSAVGELLSELAAEGKTSVDISGFSAKRFGN